MLLHPQRGARRSVDAPDTKIDMTPMIDVTFLIIVFFLCTLRFKSLEGRLGANLPRDVGVNDPSVAPVERPRLAVRVVAVGTLTRPDGAPYTAADAEARRRFVYDDSRQLEYRVGVTRTPDLAVALARAAELQAATGAAAVVLDVAPDVIQGEVVAVIDGLRGLGVEGVEFAASSAR